MNAIVANWGVRLSEALLGAGVTSASWTFSIGPAQPPLTITGLKVTPIALPDPPLLNVGGCHGPYFLRNIVELRTDGGIVGIGETHGGENVTTALERARKVVIGQNAFAYRKFARELQSLNMSCYAGIELACLDACGRATGRRLCELVGGPVRDPVEFAAYLFFRYAADHPVILSDPHLVDSRGRGDRALDSWGEVRTPEAMAAMAARFRDRWGFRVFKLKGGVLAPELEAETLKAMSARLGPERLAADRPQRPLEDRDGDPDRQPDQATADGILRRPRARPGGDGRGAPRDRAEDEHEHVRDQLRPHSRSAEAEADRRLAVRPPLLRRLRRLPGTGPDLQGRPAGR